ncbi:MAG TPA: patatin-like phospholipase family protein [Vicinamibacterales bacterium]|nr:patatin-like phospholipase family protein [Vicinamibacterales bacterium]
MQPLTNPRGLGLVLSGGGARGAYQVGVLQYLAREFPTAIPEILTGVSAGAINAAFIAARQEPFVQKLDELAEMWSTLRIDQVFRVDHDLMWRAIRWGGRLMTGGKSPLKPAKSMVDTRPLQEVLERELHAGADGAIDGINTSLRAGWLRAFALTASSYTTGQSITWVQTREDCAMPAWERPQRKSQMCSVRVDHVMASAALPFFFPAIQVDGAWFGDGGIRLTAPLSPAIHLGATRILAVTTRYARTREEADRPLIVGYPPPAQVAGVLFNAIFLDQLEDDAMQLRMINKLIESHREENRMGLRPIQLLVLRPSEDLGRLANHYEADLPKGFRFLTRGLGTKETRSNDMLSLVMFQTDYVRHLIELGQSDAAAKRDQIAQFLGM